MERLERRLKMRIKFSVGFRKNEPCFFFEGELKNFNSDMVYKQSEEQSLQLFEHCVIKNKMLITNLEIEK